LYVMALIAIAFAVFIPKMDHFFYERLGSFFRRRL
jgi:hypothetical protein